MHTHVHAHMHAQEQEHIHTHSRSLNNLCQRRCSNVNMSSKCGMNGKFIKGKFAKGKFLKVREEYPVFRTVTSLAYSIKHHLNLSRNHPGMLQLMCEGCAYKYPPLSIAMYSFIQWRRRNLPTLSQCTQDSNPYSLSRESEALPLSHCAKTTEFIAQLNPFLSYLVASVTLTYPASGFRQGPHINWWQVYPGYPNKGPGE